MLSQKVNSTTLFALAVAVALIASMVSGIPLLDQLIAFKATLDEGIEIVKNRGYNINDNLKWNEIKAAGIKITEKSWKGFLQICERLAVDFGQVQIYLDLEARVMFVYADPAGNESDKEAYYVQFL